MEGLYVRRMWMLGLPRIFFWILLRLRHIPGLIHTPDLNCVEYFAGVQSIARAFSDGGLNAAAYDICNDSVKQDFVGDLGFITAIQWAKRLIPGDSLAFFATVCSTWVWVSRSSTHRSHNNPHGLNHDGSGQLCVVQANQMVTRMVLLILFCGCRDVCWLLEQPSS
jgi:hypothetical protein